MTERPLADVRVADFTSGPAGGMATAVLCDFGAQVIKVEPPGGDRFRTMASSSLWLRGKESVEIDLKTESGRTAANALIDSCDVVVVGGPPSRFAGWGLDAATLRARRPTLIHCSVTGWGAHGPYAEHPGYEALVAARIGRMWSFEGQLKQNAPVYAAVQVATHVAAQTAVQGIVAALIQRDGNGTGATVGCSLLQALTPFDLMDGLSVQLADRDGEPFEPLRSMFPMPTLNYHPLRAADGRWIQCGNLLEHLFYSFLDAVDLLGDMLGDERFTGPPAVWSPEAIEDARDRILVRAQERTADEWMAVFAENGNVAAEPILTTAEALNHPDMVEGGCLVDVRDPERGDVRQVGPIAKFGRTPAVAGAAIATVGQHNAALAGLGSTTVERPSDARTGGPAGDPGRPLAGITILDLSTIIAAPLGMSMLADLGARVIKIEPFGGDPFRQMQPDGRMAMRMNQSKESICIDLKTPDGQQLIRELAAEADALVHNFRGSVPDKLGIAWPDLHELNPRLVWLVVNGYGPDGPSAPRPATHPVMGACAGGVAFQAGKALMRDCPTLADVRENSRQIFAANEANPDPNTSVVAGAALAMALFEARRSGAGQQVFVNMQVANAWANADDFLTYDEKPDRVAVDDEHRGIDRRYRLYEAAEGWVFLAAAGDDEFRRFCELAGCDESADLEAVFASRPATAWEQLLLPAGVGCVRADATETGRFMVEDRHMRANGWVPTVDHPRFGQVRRWPQLVTVNGVNPDAGPSPLAGQHTDAILAELGRSAAEIEDLRVRGIVNSEAP